MMQRALVAALLARGESHLLSPGADCDDVRNATEAIEVLGATVRREHDRVVVVGGGEPRGRVLDCGESGLCMRMLAPVASLFGEEITLKGSGSLARRPMGMLCAPLEALGVECRTEGGYPPLVVKGPMSGGRAEVDGSLTSQVLTGLLMALPACPAGTFLTVPVLKSRPYVQMTVELLRCFGVRVHHDGTWRQLIVHGQQRYTPAEYAVEGDWSGAAFLLAAGAIAGEVRVEGLRPDSLQADRAVLGALRRAGATVRLDETGATAKGTRLRGFELDVSESPDLLPPLAALAAHADGRSRITGVSRTKYKESDRARVLAEELGKLGADLRLDDDALEIAGRRLHGGRVEAHGDHRIAMACAVAALKAEGEVEIDGAESVSKSYPGFFQALESLAAR